VGNHLRPGLLVSFEKFGFGEFVSLQHETGEVGESFGALGFNESFGGGAEKRGESATEIASGHDVGFEEATDLAAGLLGVEAFAALLAVVVAEAEVVWELGHGATASVGEGELTQFGAIGISRHGLAPGGKLGCK